MKQSLYFAIMILCGLAACKSKIKEQDDDIYSRHLQRHVKLHIITTPLPGEKAEMNLLIFNDAEQLEQLGLKKMVDSLYKNKKIGALTIVATEAKQNEEYGLTGMRELGKAAGKPEKYNAFVINELYPFIKKKVVTRKFKTIAIAGCGTAGISAFDIAWNNADKIQKMGMFSGDFEYTVGKDTANNVFNYIASSRKRPRMLFWFYAGDQPDSSMLKNTTRLAEMMQAKKSVIEDDIYINEDKVGGNDPASWKKNFAAFLTWAFPN